MSVCAYRNREFTIRRIATREIRIVAAVILFSFAAARSGFAQESRFTISAGGGLERIAAFGAANEYFPGQNDFPVTPAHSIGTAGLNLTYAVSPKFALRFEGRYGFAKMIRLADPSDGDQVDMESSKQWAFSLGILFRLPGRIIQPWLYAGAGGESLFARDQTRMTGLGYKVVFTAPARDPDILIQGGAGVSIEIGPGWGIWAEARYIHVFIRPDAVNSGLFFAGLYFSF
jgi:hypothetical protein